MISEVRNRRSWDAPPPRPTAAAYSRRRLDYPPELELGQQLAAQSSWRPMARRGSDPAWNRLARLLGAFTRRVSHDSRFANTVGCAESSGFRGCDPAGDLPDRSLDLPELAVALRISASEAHSAVKRAAKSGLVDVRSRTARKSALLEFLVHAVPYLVPPVWTGVSRGVPTSYAAPP